MLALVVCSIGSTKICSTTSSLAKNLVVGISTDSPTMNQNITTTFDFDLDTPITGGTAYYSATLNGMGPFTSQAPLCDETSKSNDPCPLLPGHHHEESTAKNTITGKVVTTISWYDEIGSEILCAEVTTKSS